MKYLSWDEKNITDFSEENINSLYSQGYVFTRVDKGLMNQTRSVRIDLNKFELSSENRRILRKTEDIKLEIKDLPLENYHWSIHKMGKDFYETKFGDGIFSANKIKEIFTDPEKSNFNKVLTYEINSETVGYCIAYENSEIIHYSYPFYNLNTENKNIGMGMMLKAIEYAKTIGANYIYLGSAQRPTDIYKLQFKGLEWFDSKGWSDDYEKLKNTLEEKSVDNSQKHIHFIGICGVAMSALAIAFRKKGWAVTGSDVGFFPPISTHLQKQHITFYPGWHPEKMTANGKPNLVVVGNVAGSTNPEWNFVLENKIPYKSYPEVIAEYFLKEKSLVCAGTYGKTSNTTLLTWIFKHAGKNPSYMFGGLSANLEESAEITDGKWSILEGDEYKTARWDIKPKFSLYSPTHVLLTASAWDHADIYPTEKDYKNAFKNLVKMIPENGLLVACTDGENIAEVLEEYSHKLIKYGESVENDYSYRNVRQTKEGLSFDIVHKDKTYKVMLPIIGEYMAENICGCFAMAHESGIEPEKIIQALGSFRGIKRRLEKRFSGEIDIYDDIAHSPTKAISVLSTLKNLYAGKVIAIFEPNTGNRKSQSFPAYANAFENADTVIIPRLTKVKSASEEEMPAEGKELAEIISKTHKKVLLIEKDSELLEYIEKNTYGGDVVVFLGSHGFRGMIENLVDRLKS